MEQIDLKFANRVEPDKFLCKQHGCDKHFPSLLLTQAFSFSEVLINSSIDMGEITLFRL